MNVIRLQDLDLKNKRVLIRADFNVPISEGQVESQARIVATLPTILWALNAGAAVLLMSHLGRPEEGQWRAEDSLQPVADCLSQHLNRPVPLVKDWLEGLEIQPGQVMLCENVRFNIGEGRDDEALGQKMATLCDVFVMDAFGTAHRAQASTHAVAKFAKIACAGLLLQKELDALTQALEKPKRPLVAIVGGSKVSSKLLLLRSLLIKVDQLILGGGIANTFLAAAGHPIGKSLYEADLIQEASELLALAQQMDKTILLPSDVRVATEFSDQAKSVVKALDAVSAGDMILDVGPRTEIEVAKLLTQAGAIVWNGPLGVFEFPEFSQGTQSLAKAVAKSEAFSIAGGGDTLSAIEKFGVEEGISYVSTGGGAFLEFLEGKTLPAIAILIARAQGK